MHNPDSEVYTPQRIVDVSVGQGSFVFPQGVALPSEGPPQIRKVSFSGPNSEAGDLTAGPRTYVVSPVCRNEILLSQRYLDCTGALFIADLSGVREYFLTHQAPNFFLKNDENSIELERAVLLRLDKISIGAQRLQVIIFGGNIPPVLPENGEQNSPDICLHSDYLKPKERLGRYIKSVELMLEILRQRNLPMNTLVELVKPKFAITGSEQDNIIFLPSLPPRLYITQTDPSYDKSVNRTDDRGFVIGIPDIKTYLDGLESVYDEE